MQGSPKALVPSSCNLRHQATTLPRRLIGFLLVQVMLGSRSIGQGCQETVYDGDKMLLIEQQTVGNVVQNFLRYRDLVQGPLDGSGGYSIAHPDLYPLIL